MNVPSPYAPLVCCWLFLSGLGGSSVFASHLPDRALTPSPRIRVLTLSFPTHGTVPAADTAISPVTLVPSSHSAPLSLRIKPDSTLRRYTNIRLEWQLFLNGSPAQKGVIPYLSLPAGRSTLVHLPLRLPPGHEEAYLKVTGRKPALPTAARTALFTRAFALRPWQQDNTIAPTGDLSFSDTLDVFTVTSANARLQFDKQTGWLLRYEAGPILLMADTAGLQPALWTPLVQPHLQLFSTSTGSQLVIVRAEYTMPDAGCLLHLSYTINASGEMLIGESLEIDTTRQPMTAGSTPRIPPLSRLGMSWTLQQGLDSITWYGAATTADTDSIPGIVRLPVTAGRESTYLFENVRWLTITGARGNGLRILADSSLLHIGSLGKNTLEIDAIGVSSAHPASLVSPGLLQYAFKIAPIVVAKPI